jgi:hypothetical protein
MTKTQKIIAITGGVLVIAGVTWIIISQVKKKKDKKSGYDGSDSKMPNRKYPNFLKNKRPYSSCCGG